MKLTTWVAFSDTHIPDLHLPGWAILVQYLRDTQPDKVIINGDFLEMYSMGKFAQNILPGNTPKAQLNEEIKIGRKYLTEVRGAVPKADIQYVPGNHEAHLERFVAQNARALASVDPDEPPMYRTLPEALRLKELGITWHGGKCPQYRLGKLVFMHGTKTGPNAVKNETLAFGSPVVVGHNHKEQIYHFRDGDDQKTDNERLSMALGCLNLGASWMSYDNYTRGWGAGYVEEESGEYTMWSERLWGAQFDELRSPLGIWKARRTSVGYSASRLAPNPLSARRSAKH